jgi:2-polyprenyl-3-methyl-5-hydroxy-6-metoxy-1,4-benzoquinol methylase
MPLNLEQSTELCQLLGDASRQRLLILLEQFELTTAELTIITGLAQSRVSTHLARLRRAGLVQDQRAGSSARYSTAQDSTAHPVWALLRQSLDDPQTLLDRERAAECILARKHGRTWAESVAGRMELHYSPGRTWEATARGLIGLITPGRVLDIASGDGVLAELLAEEAESVDCVDISEAVIAAGQARLAEHRNVRFHCADMHDLPFPDASFETVFVMHALAYSQTPAEVIRNACRVLVPGGRLVVVTLKSHQHEAAMAAYDHQNMGIEPSALRQLLAAHQLKVEACRVTSRELRPPYFEVVTALAHKST